MDWSKMFKARVIVFGCGNTLYGDDALGPLVIENLKQQNTFDDDVVFIDAGTSIRPLLFDLILSERHPQKVIIVDITTDDDLAPGEIKEIDINEVDPKKIADFSMHQFPTTNLLKELQENTDIKLNIIVVRAAFIPEKMREGLSPQVQTALPRVVERIKQLAST